MIFRVGSFAWERSLGIVLLDFFRVGSVAWDLSSGSFRFGAFDRDGIFRFETLVWDRSIGMSRGIFRLCSFVF